MKIIIHIGFPKTGSTYLQNFLRANNQSLMEKGIAHTTLYTNENNELRHRNAYAVSSLQTYIKHAEAVGVETLLLSSEGFSHSIGYHANSLTGHEVHLLGYVRFFTSFYESAFAQKMKRAYRRTNPNYTVLTLFNNLKKLHDQDIFQSCSLFSYEKATQEGLAEHFFSQLGIKNFQIKSDMSPFEKNVSPPTAYLYFLNFIKYLPTSTDENIIFSNYFLHMSPSKETRRYLLMHPKFYYQYAERHEKELSQLSRDMDYAEYTQDSLNWLEKQTLCPWEELPREQFYDIYDVLPENLQAIIQKYCPNGKDIYNTIEKFKNKKLFPLYLTEIDKKKTPPDFVSVRKIKKFALGYDFDESLYNKSYFFEKILKNYQSHYNNLVFSKDRMRFTFRSYSAIYKKMLCLEFSRFLNNSKIYPLLMRHQKIYPEMLENAKWYLHRNYILNNLQRTHDIPIIIYGAGFLFNKYYSYFQHHQIKCILLDGECLPKKLNGIPVYRPEDVLPTACSTPIFIFIQQASLIKKKIQEYYPQCDDIVTCCF